MTRAHLLDRLIGDTMPALGTAADVQAFEASAPYDERIAAQSTYEALRLGMQRDPQAAGAALPGQGRARSDAADPEPCRVLCQGHAVGQPLRQLRRRHAGRGQLPAAAAAAELLRPVRRPGGRHRQPGESAAVGGAAGRDPARGRHQGAGHRRPAAGQRHLGQGAADQGQPAAAEGGAGDPRPGRRSAGRLRLRRAAAPPSVRPAGQRPADRGAGHRRLLPHRRHHRHAEAGAPQPCQPGLPGLGAAPDAADRRAAPSCAACRCSMWAVR